MLEQYTKASQELVWRFHHADALVGVHGQCIDGGRGGGGFDIAACSRMHDTRIRDNHREALERRDRIDRLLATVEAPFRQTIARTFEPFGRASYLLVSRLTVAGIALVRVALHTRAAWEGYCRRHEQAPPTAGWQLLEWFEDEARSLECAEAESAKRKSPRPTGHIFERVRDEAISDVEPALKAFDGSLTAYEEGIEQRKSALLESECRRTHERIWGVP